MFLFRSINEMDLNRFAEIEVNALDETDQTIVEINKLIENYRVLIKYLDYLPAKQNEKTMVPLGKMAYMSGKLMDTNQVIMSLGDSWFVETSAQHARNIAERRITSLEVFLDKLKKQRKLFETRSEFTEQFKKEGEDFVEISEKFTEEEYARLKEEHRMNVKKRQTSKNEKEESSLEEFSKHEDDMISDPDSSKQEVCEIHEGYKSLLSDLGIDCTNIIFTNKEEVNKSAKDDNRDYIFCVKENQKQEVSKNPMDVQESDTISGTPLDDLRFDNDEINEELSRDDEINEELNTLPEADYANMSSILLDKHFEEDEGFKQLLMKLGFNEEKPYNNELLPYKDHYNKFNMLNDKSDIYENNFESTAGCEKTLQVTQKDQINMKKCVTWNDGDGCCDDCSNDSNHDDENDDHTNNDSSGNDEQKPIIVNFKHSSTPMPFIINEAQTHSYNTIRTPGDINKQYHFTPKSILKRSMQHAATQRPQDLQNIPQEMIAKKVLTPAMSALVVERNNVVSTHVTFKVDSHSSTNRMSKFKTKMTGKTQLH